MSRRIAIHEAGHAVAAVTCGLPLALASVVPDERSSGHVLFPDGTEATVGDKLLVSLAGYAAERALTRTSYARSLRGASSDFDDAEATAQAATLEVGGDAMARALIADAHTRALRFAIEHAGSIKAVAGVLLRRRVLSGHDVRRIVASADTRARGQLTLPFDGGAS